MTRTAIDNPAIYLSKSDGLWHCWPTIGWNEEKQKPIRKHIKRKTSGEVKDELDEVRAELKKGAPPKAGKPETLADILREYLTTVREERAYNTWQAYRPIVELRLIPELGKYRTRGSRNVLEPKHVRDLWAKLRAAGVAPSYIRQHHRVLSRALKFAMAEGMATRNVCTLIDGPRVRRRRRTPLTPNAPELVIGVLAGRPDELRWLLALLSGLRQGETLGLHWDKVVWAEDGMTAAGVWTHQQVQRRTWEHGCGDAVGCVARRPRRVCRTEPCRSWDHGCGPQPELDRPGACGKSKAWACPQRAAVPCRLHGKGRADKTKPCPPPCPPACTRHASTCPQRVNGGLLEVDLKSEGSERYIPVHPYVGRLFKAQKARQAAARLRSGQRWQSSDRIFTGRHGQAIDARRDHEVWEQILVLAGVPDAALHAARSAAATIALDCGTDISTLQELLGHSDIRVTKGYVDERAEAKVSSADAVGARFLGGPGR